MEWYSKDKILEIIDGLHINHAKCRDSNLQNAVIDEVRSLFTED